MMNFSISQKLRWGAMVIALSIIIFIGAIIFLSVSLQQADQKQQLTAKITALALQSVIFRNEHSVHPGDRPKIQWLSANKKLSRLLDEAAYLFAYTPEKELFEDTRNITLDSRELFGELVKATEERESPAVIESLNNQITVQLQTRASNTLHLSELARRGAERAITIFEITVIVLGIIILAIIALFYIISRSVAESLRTLSEDFTKLSALDFTTTTTTTTGSNDEIGQLARAFNTMVRKLKESYRKKEDTRLDLVATAEKLAVIAEEKERVRLKLVETTDKLAREEKLATIGKLAGIMGHEIRNPLGVIRNSIYFINLKLKESLDEKVKKHMHILETEIDIADKIISDVLGFARTRQPSLATVEINSVISEVLSMANIPKTIKVEANLGKSLPKINIDRAQVKQVFVNIISNAIEAMPKGGELRVTTSQTDSFISIAVKDTGVGIPKENIDKLFTPLFSTKTKGLGLGLAACQNIIVAHHGKIEFESKEGQGTTFIIKLPIAQKINAGQKN